MPPPNSLIEVTTLIKNKKTDFPYYNEIGKMTQEVFPPGSLFF